MKEIKTYVSADGKEFRNKEECEAYEKELIPMVETKFAQLKTKGADAYELGIYYVDGDNDDGFHIYIDSEETAEIVRTYLERDGRYIAHKENIAVGKHIVAFKDYDGDYETFDLDLHIKAIVDYANWLKEDN